MSRFNIKSGARKRIVYIANVQNKNNYQNIFTVLLRFFYFIEN